VLIFDNTVGGWRPDPSIRLDEEVATMSTPCSQLVDEPVTHWYHCVSRRLRRARLCGGDRADRKDWIVARLRELVEVFAIRAAAR
jgi:hypothetical protein